MAMLIGLAALAAVSAAAPDSQPVPLWRDITAGETPEQVADKIARIPGVKSAKARGDKVKVRYQNGKGIEIFGLPFAISTEFVDAKLSRVILLPARSAPASTPTSCLG